MNKILIICALLVAAPSVAAADITVGLFAPTVGIATLAAFRFRIVPAEDFAISCQLAVAAPARVAAASTL